MSKILTRICAFTIIITILSSLNGCSGSSEQSKQMDQAENLMESRPDSALAILHNIQSNDLHGKKQRARYALLKSMALDKNYIDTTTFDVLQPAIDYYLEKGSPDEKLKTYYYQGRIYQNQGDDDSALKSMLFASDFSSKATDSLSAARNSVALGSLYIKQYSIEKFIEHNLFASGIYRNMRKTNLARKSLANAFDGYVMLRKKNQADSVMFIYKSLSEPSDLSSAFPMESMLSYLTAFGSPSDIKQLLNQSNYSDINTVGTIDLARAYTKVGRLDEASRLLKVIELNGTKIDSLKYLAAMVDFSKENKDYASALDNLERYSNLLANYQNNLISQGGRFNEEKHKIEVENLLEIGEKDNNLWLLSCCLLATIFVSILIYYRYHLSKEHQLKLVSDNKNLRLQQEISQQEKVTMALERDRNALAVENLLFHQQKIEEERDCLKEMLKTHAKRSKLIHDTITNRLSVLNGLLAQEITGNAGHASAYSRWIESIQNDKIGFMNSTRLAFTATHPEFIEYLEQHSLTEEEINFSCLYALGLNGKDIGSYIKIKSHYNISSNIRKKLNLDSTGTNLALYIRNKLSELGSQCLP